MKLANLLKLLSKHEQIMVTGPQRSGTTIASIIIATELHYNCILEESFEISNLLKCFSIYNSSTKFVIQAPALCAYAHLMPGAVVFMNRPLREILTSQERINWREENSEKSRYFRLYDNCCIAQIKKRVWNTYQKKYPNRFELKYHSLKDHRLWIDSEKRKNFQTRQTVL